MDSETHVASVIQPNSKYFKIWTEIQMTCWIERDFQGMKNLKKIGFFFVELNHVAIERFSETQTESQTETLVFFLWN